MNTSNVASSVDHASPESFTPTNAKRSNHTSPTRQACIRADQPAGNGQGRAVRPVFPIRQVAAPAVPRRIRREPGAPSRPTPVGVERAESLYEGLQRIRRRSVAQLGGAHVACEYVSNILTKILEWGRLMAYLEQSTRYVPYTDKLHGRWRYHVPAEVEGPLRDRYVTTMDAAFETYASLIDGMQKHFAARYPRAPQDSEGVHRAAIRAKALDTLRGMLPAATQSNVGIYGTGKVQPSASAAHARASTRGSQAVRRPDAGRAEEARPRVPDARRPARARRALEPVPRVHPRRDGERGGGAGSRTSRRSRAKRSRSTDSRSRRRDQDRRGGALRRHRSAGRPVAGAGAPHDALGARVGAGTPTSGSAATVVTGREVRSSARRIASTCSRTTARSAIAASPAADTGMAAPCRRVMATASPTPCAKRASSTAGRGSWMPRPISMRRSVRRGWMRPRRTRSRWRIASASTWR